MTGFAISSIDGLFMISSRAPSSKLIKNDLKDLVRNSVEETLNALLDHEADELVNAEKLPHSETQYVVMTQNELFAIFCVAETEWTKKR